MKSLSNEELHKISLTIAMLSADAVEAANSGHPGMPMGCADQASVLWLKHLRYNTDDPKWLNRDRFVLSNGHGSMLQYSLLHLAGFDLSMDDLKNFRQWGSKTPGHPESFMTPGVECTTGPLGQGIANAVGMALGSKLLAKQYNTPEFSLIDHNVFCIAGDGCMMEGISGEASSVAGHLGLGNLIVLYDDNHISIAGDTALAFTEDVAKRYDSYGWHTLSADGHNFDEIDAALQAAIDEKDRPSLISLRTIIGKGSPNKADTSGVHGSPLGADELKLTKEHLDWPTDKTFFVPDEVRDAFAARKEELGKEYVAWQDSYRAWSEENASKSAELEARVAGDVPKDFRAQLVASVVDMKPGQATRKISSAVLQVAAKEVPALVGGSADLEPSTLTEIKDSSSISKSNFSGRNIHFGVREHAMGAIMNGLAYYGGFIPFGSTFLTFSDYMRPAIRIAALSNLPGLFIFTHDSVFLGEDGPTHQAVEHVASLRMIPNLRVMRPASPLETAVCYGMAIERKDGPAVFSLTRQNVDEFEGGAKADPDEIAKGAYTVIDSDGAPELVLVATGSEVPLAVSVGQELSKSLKTRVVSMPCVEEYRSQPESFRSALIPTSAKKVVIEAGATFGWLGIVDGSNENTLVIGIDDFGASAPYEVIAEKLGFTTEGVLSRVREKFAL